MNDILFVGYNWRKMYPNSIQFVYARFCLIFVVCNTVYNELATFRLIFSRIGYVSFGKYHYIALGVIRF